MAMAWPSGAELDASVLFSVEVSEPLAPVTSAILTISLVAMMGLLLGNVRVRGVGLGSAGVLFAGLVFGQMGMAIDHDISHFAKEFGLILFVFTMGIQLGPGIIQLWRQNGLVLNAMAVAIVSQGALLAVLAHFVFGVSSFTAAGLFSGATTNTPSLGAAEQAAAMLSADASRKGEGAESVDSIASAYAVAYPGGVIGIIVSMLLIRRFCRIDVQAESQQLIEYGQASHEAVERRCILVDNARLCGTPFGQIAGIEETGVRISRVKRQGDDSVHPATEETLLEYGDLIQVVGTRAGLERFTPLIGQTSEVNLMLASGNVEFQRVYVTEPSALNRPLRDLSLDHLFNATVTRIIRADIEIPARGSSRFHYGDIAHVVGDRVALDQATKFLGNSTKALQDTPYIPLFMGIVIGVMIGMIPFQIPGVPFPVRLGLAGGPLLAAIVLSVIGNVGKVIWYIPSSANLALRHLGIILFLACAGLSAGSSFFAAATSLAGIKWMLAGLMITMVPLLTTGVVARFWVNMNYFTICGVIAGSMTDPPALAFANSLSESEQCSTAYAAVYPLTMVLRIIAAQAIVFLLM
jgi:putative transport protein